jgi:hypothetical protein
MVLTVTTGRLLCPDIDDLYDVLGYLTGDDLMTHQLGRGAVVCGPYVLDQHPQLVGVEPPQAPQGSELFTWLRKAVDEHGPVLPLSPLPAGVWEHKDPLVELAEMWTKEES